MSDCTLRAGFFWAWTFCIFPLYDLLQDTTSVESIPRLVLQLMSTRWLRATFFPLCTNWFLPKYVDAVGSRCDIQYVLSLLFLHYCHLQYIYCKSKFSMHAKKKRRHTPYHSKLATDAFISYILRRIHSFLQIWQENGRYYIYYTPKRLRLFSSSQYFFNRNIQILTLRKLSSLITGLLVIPVFFSPIRRRRSFCNGYDINKQTNTDQSAPLRCAL